MLFGVGIAKTKSQNKYNKTICLTYFEFVVIGKVRKYIRFKFPFCSRNTLQSKNGDNYSSSALVSTQFLFCA